MLWCLQSYYEYSQDHVIDLMTNYFKWQMTVPDDQLLEDYWEKSCAVVIISSVSIGFTTIPEMLSC